MTGFLSQLSDAAVQVFAIASMASVGLRYTAPEILDPLRDVRGVVLALTANFVAVPLLALLILRILPLEVPYAVGLLLVACAAGAPFVIKLTQIAGGDVAFSAGLLVLLLVVSVAYMPFVVPRLTPEAEVGTWAIASPLVLTMLLPLGLALGARALAPAAGRLLPLLGVLTNAARVVLVVLAVGLNIGTVLGVLGEGAILAAILLVAGAFGIGWVMGGFGEHLRDEMALGTSQRNFAAAMVAATQSFEDEGVLVMAVVVSLVTLALLFPAARVLNRQVPRGAGIPG